MDNNQHKDEEANQRNSGEEANSYHKPVLLKEAIDALNIHTTGTYVDATFGGGGHSREILNRLGSAGRLFVFDQDLKAALNKPDDPRIIFLPHNFRHMQRFLRLHKQKEVDGILADLGVSSHQFDEATRGFSTRFEGDLDMRMDYRQELTAQKIIQTYSEQQLHMLFEKFGEVTNSKTLAKSIVVARDRRTIKTTADLKFALQQIVKGNPNKYFAQVFQALRIEVNDELGALKELLQLTPELLSSGGRVAIITFHSLEDRLVKNFFKMGAFEEVTNHDPYGHPSVENKMKVVTKKPIVATEKELKDNPRSRSAKLRVAEKK